MSIPTVALATGAAMPIVGLGTWKSKPGQVEAAVKAALDVGYRHIDCAAVYGNETEVGSAIKEKIADGTVKREDIFITSKLWNTKHRKADVEPALKKTLADLQLDYIDLYLIHWPHGFEAGDNPFPKNEDGTVRYDYTSYLETWEALEACVDAGLTKAIGLSNFNSQQIKEICDKARIKPAVLQVEVHPYMNQEALIGKAKAMGLAVTAYSPLGSPDRPWAKEGEPTLLDDPKIVDMAKKYNKSPAQICLKFQVQRGVIVIPKSVTPSRIKENSELFDFELSDEDMATIKAFNRPWRACVPMLDGKPRDAAHPLYPFNLDEDAA